MVFGNAMVIPVCFCVPAGCGKYLAGKPHLQCFKEDRHNLVEHRQRMVLFVLTGFNLRQFGRSLLIGVNQGVAVFEQPCDIHEGITAAPAPGNDVVVVFNAAAPA